MAGFLKAENGVEIKFEDSSEFPTFTNIGKSASWDSVSPITSFAPIKGFASSTAFSFSITIRFSIEEGSTMSRVHHCRSLVVPDYDNGLYRPPSVIITIEKYIQRFQGVCNSVNETIPDDAVWIDGEPSVIDVSMSFDECYTSMQPYIYGKEFMTILNSGESIQV